MVYRSHEVLPADDSSCGLRELAAGSVIASWPGTSKYERNAPLPPTRTTLIPGAAIGRRSGRDPVDGARHCLGGRDRRSSSRSSDCRPVCCRLPGPGDGPGHGRTRSGPAMKLEGVKVADRRCPRPGRNAMKQSLRVCRPVAVPVRAGDDPGHGRAWPGPAMKLETSRSVDPCCPCPDRR
jgi:hypothetical protein